MIELSQNRIIGLVGGMGPLAGLHLFNQILLRTDASTDHDHLSTILMSLPKYITDRTAYIMGHDACNPAYAITQIILKLEQAGADIIGLACNTAHAPEIYDVIEEELCRTESKISLVHMPKEVCSLIKERFPDASRIGLMTTTGTYHSGLYARLLNEMGYETILPDLNFQNNIINKMIYDEKFGLKSHQNGIAPEIFSLMEQAKAFFKLEKTDLIILGCTELSMLSGSPVMDGITVVDSTEALALALIREATRTEQVKQTEENNLSIN